MRPPPFENSQSKEASLLSIRIQCLVPPQAEDSERSARQRKLAKTGVSPQAEDSELSSRQRKLAEAGDSPQAADSEHALHVDHASWSDAAPPRRCNPRAAAGAASRAASSLPSTGSPTNGRSPAARRLCARPRAVRYTAKSTVYCAVWPRSKRVAIARDIDCECITPSLMTLWASNVRLPSYRTIYKVRRRGLCCLRFDILGAEMWTMKAQMGAMR